jgi:hypothetical protein
MNRLGAALAAVALSLSVTGGAFAQKASSHDCMASLAALKAHVENKATLTDQQIKAHTTTIQENQKGIDDSQETIQACSDFIASYDAKHQPLWIGHKGLNRKKSQPGDEIHWAAFWVMQLVFDEVYDAETLAKFESTLKGIQFGTADYFPGKVDQKVDPNEIYQVKINGSYPKTWGHPVFHEDLPARKATGAYLAPGTIVTIKVPDAIVKKGYQVRVGAHSWDHAKKPKVKRLYRVSAVYPIDSNEIKVANPVGGAIYIEVPYQADAGVIELSIKNAARSPFYAQLPFHQTTLKEWREQQRNFKAPWADFQSEKFMMQVPTSWIYKLNDPETLITAWDKSMDITNDLMGRPHLHGRETLYDQVDTQLRGGAFHPGYPSGNCGHNPSKDFGGNYTKSFLIAGPRHAVSHQFHEMGHGFLFTKYAGDREAAVNLLHVAVMNQLYQVGWDEAFRSSRSVKNKYHTLDTTALTWMMSDHFIDQAGMNPAERSYQLKGHAKYVDVARLFGWDTLSRFWKSTHEDFENGKPWPRDVKDTDRFNLRLSECAKADIRPLIHFWGILTQDDQASDAAIKAAGLAPSAKSYDALKQYQSLIPEDNKAFREFALKWWGREPRAKGFTTERNHAARWKDYDEKTAAQTKKVMQGIIDRYFPNGRPPQKTNS